MKYMGSKVKHAKEILKIVLKERRPNQFYVEPFVGGCNIIDKVDGNRIGNDINSFLIYMWIAIKNGWEPPDTIDEPTYQNIKSFPANYPPQLVAFVAIGCSYSGKWWGGYARGNTNNGLPRNYCLESKKNILKQKENLNSVFFTSMDYKNLIIPKESIVYCDPPYIGTTKYKNSFAHDQFWDWVRKISKEGHSVFVSEYSAPDDFECLWEKTVNNTLVKNTGSKQGVERLWQIKN